MTKFWADILVPVAIAGAVAAAMFASCTAEPPQTLMQPGVKTLTGEAGYDSAHLEATLENADNYSCPDHVFSGRGAFHSFRPIREGHFCCPLPKNTKEPGVEIHSEYIS